MTEKIHSAMAAILADAEGVRKSQRNEQQGYDFRGYDDIVPMIKSVMAKHGVYDVIDSIDDVTISEYETRNNVKMQHVILRVTYRFIATDGSSVVCCSIGEGSDSGDKAVNKAATSCEKNLLVHRFKLAMGNADDSERESPERISISRPPQSAMAQGATQGMKSISEAQAIKVISMSIDAGKKESRHGWDVIGECLMVMGLARPPDRCRKPEMMTHLRQHLNSKTIDTLFEMIQGWPESIDNPKPVQSATGKTADDKFADSGYEPAKIREELPF